jgi:EF-P beta-lysylation protein EpmB
MIHRTGSLLQTDSLLSWQQQLTDAITDPLVLLKRLKLDESLLPAATIAAKQFPLRVPHAFVDLMQIGDSNDPLLRQVLPLQEELISVAGYSTDPIKELAYTNKGIIHKYRGRVLLLVTGHCAINCRYCFRRHFPYEENRLSRDQWLDTIKIIAADTSIEEVIYSGGDPLASNDKQLAWLTQQIAAIPHIKRLRIHSRLPVVIPERINDECLSWLSNHRLDTAFVLHINHANEISPALIGAITHLRNAGIIVLNQTVLLKNINDSVGTLKDLSDQLFAAGVLPYYLHLFDPVSGAAHFDVSLKEAKQLHQEMLACLPGYLVPKLVKDIEGEASKIPAINIS